MSFDTREWRVKAKGSAADSAWYWADVMIEACDEIDLLRAKLAASERSIEEMDRLRADKRRAEKAEKRIDDLISSLRVSIESQETFLKTCTNTGSMWLLTAYKEVLDFLAPKEAEKPRAFDYVIPDDEMHPDIAAAAEKQK